MARCATPVVGRPRRFGTSSNLPSRWRFDWELVRVAEQPAPDIADSGGVSTGMSRA